MSSILDALPEASTVRAPAGYCARCRVHVGGVTMDELDAAVIEAGGRIEGDRVRSAERLPGRPAARIVGTFWYVIPEGAQTVSGRG